MPIMGLELEDLEQDRERVVMAGVLEAAHHSGPDGGEVELEAKRFRPLPLARGEARRRHRPSRPARSPS